MANNANFNLNIKTKVDSAELNKLKQQLKEIQQMANNTDMTTGMNPTQIQHMVTAARQLDAALTAAFDVDLNAINIQKFNDYLNKTGTNLQQIQKGLYNAGVSGKASFTQATAQLFKFNTAARQANVFLDKMATTMANTVRWSITSTILNTIVGSVQKAYYYVEDLDTGLNDIRIVTGKSADEMARFTEEANNAAKALAVSTTDYTEGALIYYQQGLDDETVKTLTDITAKTSNVTGQSMQAVSEQLTAVWNGYQVANEAAREGMQVYEEYVDKMAAVGAATASDLEELATAMSKVASAANAMGVDFDQLSAQIATIVSVTRQAPESVGTALKTIYARIGDLKIEGVDEFGVSLGNVSSQLEQVGIHIMDQKGNLRDVGIVMEEVAGKWTTWNEAQQQSVATAIAGKRQYNNLLALFENWDMYTDTLETAQGAAGTLDKQQSIALDSLENKLEQLTATAEDLYDSLFDEEGLKDLVDGIIPVVQRLANMADAIGGLNTLLPALGSIGVQVFSKHLANGLATFRHNLLLSTDATYKQNQAIQFLADKYKQLNFKDSTGMVNPAQKAIMNEMVQYVESMLEKRKLMTQEEEAYYNKILDEKAVLAEQAALLNQAKEGYAQNPNVQSLFGVEPPSTEKIEQYSSSLVFLESQLKSLSNVKGTIPKVNVDKAKIAVYQFRNELEKLGVSGEGLKTFDKKYENFLKTTQTGRIPVQNVRDLLNYLKQFPEAAGDVDKLEREFKELEQRIKGMQGNLDNTLNFKAMTDNVMKTVGAIGQLASAWNTLSQLDDIWNNETLSNGEKLTQTLMNLSFMIPMVVTALSTLNTTFEFTTVISEAWMAITGPATAGTTAWTKAQLGLNAAFNANPIGAAILAITTLIALIGSLIWVYDQCTVTAEEAGEALQKSLDSYKEGQDKLHDLQTQLEDTTTALAELQRVAAQGDLSIVQQTELNNLQAKENLLKAQIRLQERLNEIEAEKVAKAVGDALTYRTYDTDRYDYVSDTAQSGPNSMRGALVYNWAKQYKDGKYINSQGYETLKYSNYEDYSEMIQYYRQLIADAKANDDEYIGDYYTEDVEATIDSIEDNYIAYFTRLSEDAKQQLEALSYLYQHNEGGINNSKIQQLEQYVEEYYRTAGVFDESIEDVVNSIFGTQEGLDAAIAKSLNKENKTVDKNAFIASYNTIYGQGGDEAFKNFEQQAQTMGVSMYSLLNGVEEFGVKILSTNSTIEDLTLSTVELNKVYDEQFDRFWELTKQIDVLSDKLSDLDELQSHLHGQELINNLKHENDLLNKQAEVYDLLAQKQLALANEYAAELRKMGVEFDTKTGYITNYEDITRAYSPQKDTESEDYKNFMRYLEAYEELRENMIERANEQDRIYYEKISNNLQAWETEIQMRLDTKELDRAWNDFTKTMEEDFKSIYTDFDNEFENLTSNMTSYFQETKDGLTGTLSEDMNAAQRVIDEMEELQKAAADANETNNGDIFVSLTEGKEKLKELYQQLMDDAESAKQLWQDAWDTYLDAIDEAAERTSDLSDEFDRINDNLEYQRELTELIYGPEAYSIQREIYQAQLDNSLEQVDFARQQVEIWQQYYDSAEEGSEEQLKYYELLTEAQDKLNESILNHIQIIKNDYANAINEALADIDVALGGDFGLEGMREEWDRAVEEEDKYYNGLERIYQLTTLQNKYQNAINNTADTKYQASIKKMMEDQLATLQDKEKLTEYDIELAEKRLTIAEKQAALEDAQNAKNAMKLVRGTDGNWSYQYVADTEGIEEKQQDLMDSYNDLYEFSQEAQRESVEAFLKAKEEYYAEMQEIASNEKLTEDEKLQAFNELHNQYFNAETGILTILQKEYEDKTKEFSRITSETLIGYYQADEDAFDKMTDNEREYIEGFLGDLKDITYPELYKAIQLQYDADELAMKEYTDANSLTWNTAASQMAAKWNGTDEDSVASQLQAAYQKITDATNAYSAEMTKLKDKAGKDFTDISSSVGLAEKETEKLRKKVQGVIDLIGTPDGNSGLSAFKKKVDEIAGSWEQAYKNVQTMIDKIKEALGMETGELFAGNNEMPDNLSNIQTMDYNSGWMIDDKSYYSFGGQWYGTQGNKGITWDKESNKLAVDLYNEDTQNHLLDPNQTLYRAKTTAGKWSGWFTSEDKLKDYIGEENVDYIYNAKVSELTDPELWKHKDKEYNYQALNDITIYRDTETWDSGLNFEAGRTLKVIGKADNNSYEVEYSPHQSSQLYTGYITEKDYKQLFPTGMYQFDTGGYTGEWDSSGRLAMLHQKELVLNASDTVNMLETVKAVRDIAATVGSAIKGNVYSMLVEKMSGIAVGAPWARESNDNAQPNVFNITAEFPNANSVAEIQEAILSLPNLASQYLAENRR